VGGGISGLFSFMDYTPIGINEDFVLKTTVIFGVLTLWF